MRVDRNILREVDRNMRDLQEKQGAGYYIRLYKRREAFLRKLASFHSASLEHPVEASLALKKGPLSREARRIGKSQNVIDRAWQELAGEKDYFKQHVVNRVNYIILNDEEVPDEIGSSPYRDGRVTLGLKFTPPNQAKVPELMDLLYTRLNGQYSKDAHPLETAIEIHFGIATIQPFRDGNKRTARLMQARKLHTHGYPCPVIPVGERSLYLGLLDEAALLATDDPQRSTTKETQFANYLAARVNTSLERMLGRQF